MFGETQNIQFRAPTNEFLWIQLFFCSFVESHLEKNIFFIMGEIRDEDLDYEPTPKKGKPIKGGGKKKGGKKGKSYSPPESPLPQDVFERIEKIFQKPKDFDIKVYRD